jgi:hypothetical protein
MNSDQLLIAHAVKFATFLALAGIIGRRRYTTCFLFPVYLLAILVGNALPSFWPETFYTQWFWILKQGVYDLLKLGVGLELAFRIFRTFPGTHRRALMACATVLGITTVGIITSNIPIQASQKILLTEWYPRVAAGTIWLLTAIVGLVVWYRLPVERFHRAILLGFSSFLLVTTTLVNILGRWGYDQLVTLLGSVATLAYLAVMAWWAWAALTPDGEPEVVPTSLVHGLIPTRA